LMDSIHVTPGVFSMYRASALRAVGGFDAGNLTEDMEIALRLHDGGWRIENALDAVSYTLCPQGFRQLYRQRLRWYRGALQNTFRYRHMLFNRSYGNLGVFFLPASLLSVLVIIGVFAFLVHGYGALAAQSVWQYGLIDWDWAQLLGDFDLARMFDAVPTTAALFSLIGFGMGAVILGESYRAAKLRGNRLGAALYLVLFPVLMMAFWAAALAAEAVRAPRKW
ncbi:MAG TPA: glycosyltransferase family 2 protein, partial [archaeon]|nr:glycosyltransferase family 2 protein [archaeon]